MVPEFGKLLAVLVPEFVKQGNQFGVVGIFDPQCEGSHLPLKFELEGVLLTLRPREPFFEPTESQFSVVLLDSQIDECEINLAKINTFAAFGTFQNFLQHFV